MRVGTRGEISLSDRKKRKERKKIIINNTDDDGGGGGDGDKMVKIIINIIRGRENH